MALWSIEACAVAEDSRWMDFPIWADVVVRAPTAALARRTAAGMEAALLDDGIPPGNETPAFRSAFTDEKLYRVRRLRHLPGCPQEGPWEVISARQARAAGRV
ncbi:MAG: hypothetical protein ACFCUW_11985 [Kiloniellaceae bacterium]